MGKRNNSHAADYDSSGDVCGHYHKDGACLVLEVYEALHVSNDHEYLLKCAFEFFGDNQTIKKGGWNDS